MDTKLVSQWKLTPQLAERHGISSNVEETIENIREQAVEQFLLQSQTTNPITQLLNQCYQQLTPILAAERWVCLENNIYLDKRAGGFWLMKSFGKYASGKNIDEIETAINQAIADPINEWVIPAVGAARCLCSLKDAPFATVDCQRYSNGYKYEYTGIKLLGDFQYVLYDYNSQTRGAHLDARLSDIYYNEGIALPFTYFDTEALSPRALFIE
ncbi:TPA: molecular chaperone DnaK, partial [Vibrio cholerae]